VFHGLWSSDIQPTPPHRSVDERITAALSDADRRIPFAELSGFRVRTAILYARLAGLTAAGCVVKSDQGYRLAAR
jgi:hypothetical protein